ncbi:hypothetical protein [Panacagrimonas sp.]|uniref:hypothetical protein n=1 Tax=Panacagrimonas sp. TaxID=2480088 RepID=UPI003B51F67F
MNLSADIARCDGVQYDGEFREGCDDCLRRTAQRGDRAVMIEPPALVVFECEMRVEGNTEVKPTREAGSA